MPYTTDPTALEGQLGQRLYAAAYDYAGAFLQDLQVEQAQITFDTEWAPHVQATLTCKVPSTGLNDLDPRVAARVRISAGYFDPATPGMEDVQPVADLGIRRRQITRGEGGSSMVLTLASDEALLQDWAGVPADVLSGDATTIAAGTHVATACTTLIRKGLGAGTVVNSVAVNPSLTLDTAAQIVSGTVLWDLIAGLASYRDYHVYDAGLRAWEVKPRPLAAGTPVHRIAYGENLVESESTLSRDGDDDKLSWGNTVIAKWESSSTTNPLENRGYAATPGTVFDPAVKPRKVVTVDMAGAASATYATRNARAETIRPRVLVRGRELRMTAVNAWWLRPTHTVEALLPTWGAARNTLVSRVAFRLPSGLMDVTLRHPDDSAVVSGE